MSLYALGPFRFGLRAPAPQALSRDFPMRWQPMERIGRRPAQQFLGPGEEVLILDGVLYPEFTGGLNQIEGMRRSAQTGVPYMFVSGAGLVFGRFVIRNIRDVQTYLAHNGAPRKVEFSIELVAYGEDVWAGLAFF